MGGWRSVSQSTLWWAPALPGQGNYWAEDVWCLCKTVTEFKFRQNWIYVVYNCVSFKPYLFAIVMSILCEAPRGEVHFVRLLGGHEMLHWCSGARCYTLCDMVVMVPNGFVRQKKKISHPAFIFVTLSPEYFCAHCFIEPQALFPEGPSGAKALWAQFQGALRGRPVHSWTACGRKPTWDERPWPRGCSQGINMSSRVRK